MPGADPLRPSVYLTRNANKTLPLVGVIVLAVMLIAGIVSLMDSIPLSIRTIYNYSRFYLGVTPRGDAELTPQIASRIRTESPVPVDRIVTARASDAVVKSIVGNWPFVVLALTQDDMRYYLERLGNGRLEGRLPAAGEVGAVISEPVARNLGLRLGDDVLGPDKREAFSPLPVPVVGIVQSPEWMILAPIEYHQQHHFPPIDVLLVFARDEADQRQLDRWAEETFRGERARVYAYHLLEEESDQMFATLYKILNVVIGTLVVVITLMMGMLMNIYQSQRLQEFGLLQALGYTRERLLRRLLGETALVVVLGWALGMVCAWALLSLVKAQLMDPSAYSLDVASTNAYAYTVPVPIAIFLAASLTLMLRFRRFDPVGIVERRLV